MQVPRIISELIFICVPRSARAEFLCTHTYVVRTYHDSIIITVYATVHAACRKCGQQLQDQRPEDRPCEAHGAFLSPVHPERGLDHNMNVLLERDWATSTAKNMQRVWPKLFQVCCCVLYVYSLAPCMRERVVKFCMHTCMHPNPWKPKTIMHAMKYRYRHMLCHVGGICMQLLVAEGVWKYARAAAPPLVLR